MPGTVSTPSILLSGLSAARTGLVVVSSSRVLYPTLSNYLTTLRVDETDNGIGMTPEEMTKNLVRARSSLLDVHCLINILKGNPRQIWDRRVSCTG